MRIYCLLLSSVLFVQSDCACHAAGAQQAIEELRRQGTLRMESVTLNLGRHSREYLVNPAFRRAVNALVRNEEWRVYSDLRVLDLSGAGVLDISPLTRFPYLESLDLSDNPGLGNHFDPLAVDKIGDIRSLRFLNLSNNPGINTVLPLLDLVNLVELDLSGTQVQSVARLTALRRLELLTLISCDVVDVDELSARHPNRRNLTIMQDATFGLK